MQQIPTVDTHFVIAALERYERPLTSYVYRLLGNLEAARDVVQDAFLKLCDQRRDEIEKRVAEWLYTVCRNAAIDVKRKEKHNASGEIDFDFFVSSCAVPGEKVEKEEQYSALYESLQKLTPREQEVLRLRFQHDLSYKEISAATNQSVSHVGFLIHTGLQKLKAKLSKKQANGNSNHSTRNGAVSR